MHLIIVLIAMIVAPVVSVPASAHEWYSGLRSPSGVACCNERDCRPVPARVNPRTRREEIWANGAWYPIEYDKVLPFSSPDGGYHACWAYPVGRPVFRCIILPGMASLAPSEALQGLPPGSLPKMQCDLRSTCVSTRGFVSRGLVAGI
jgi:hypothetical protein